MPIAAATLPEHHDDPFDRLLIAQAQLENLTIVTSDMVFDAYDVKVLDARRRPVDPPFAARPANR